MKEHLVRPILLLFPSPDQANSVFVMKVFGLDIDVGLKGALVEENRATCVMGHVEANREKLVVNILGRLLQSNDTTLSCNLLSKGIFFSPPGSRVPVVDAKPPLHNRMRWVAMRLLELFMCEEKACFLSGKFCTICLDASRNSAVAL